MASNLRTVALMLQLLLLWSSADGNRDLNPQIHQAIRKCREKLSQDSTFPKAQHMLGMLLEATADPGDLEEIAELSYQAGCDDLRPLGSTSRADALIRAGKTFLLLGRIDRAIHAYQRALSLVEEQTTAETILHQVTPIFFREDPQTATIDSGIRMSQLASLLTQRFPSSPVIHQFQGAVSRKAGDVEAAFRSYHQAATLHSPPSAESYILAASAARLASRDLQTQMGYLQKALEATDHMNDADLIAEVWNNMGIAYKAAGQNEQAIASFQSALTAKAGDGHALAHLASLNAPQSATTFDAGYVRGLFDGYSSRFEDELVNTLEYKGHEWVALELARLWKGATSCSPTIVDLGCGTGLVGEALARELKTSPSLIGVDLSLRMVELARLKSHAGTSIYRKVVQGDASSFLTNLDRGSVQAVVAADVFIYIGEIVGVLSASWDALSLDGQLVFSVEITEEGMLLLPSGRFGHSKRYIQNVAKQAGFDLKLWREGPLRKQRGAPVQGAVVVLQKKEKS